MKSRFANMRGIRLFVSVLICLLIFNLNCVAQIDTVLLSERASHLFPSFPVKSSFTSVIDQRPEFNFIYSANMQDGLGIYEFDSADNLTSIVELDITEFNNLDVSTVEKSHNLLYLGIGDFQDESNPSSGLAIVDVSDPYLPLVLHVWDTTAYQHGISHLLVDSNYVYLATMEDGLIILEMGMDKNVVFKSHLQIDLDYPSPSNNAHNARGMDFRNDTLFLCFDRGGLRVVDVTDKSNPVEIYKYINPDLNNQAAAAYNDVVISGNRAFISVDYCGLEVVDIGKIPFESVLWFNPRGCNGVNWSGSPVHFNEVKLANNDSLLFVTAGQSEVFIFDVTNPDSTKIIGEFANLSDTLAAHGLDVFDNNVVLSLIHTPFHIPPFTPFFSDPGGLKILNYEVFRKTTDLSSVYREHVNLAVFPNPVVMNKFTVESEYVMQSIRIVNNMGVNVFEATSLDTKHFEFNSHSLNPGLYVVVVSTKKGYAVEKLVVE